MGYDLHITRAEMWTETEGNEIPVEEWLTYVEGDTELVPDPPNGAYSVIWKDENGGSASWFDWYDGNIYTTNPDRVALGKMLTIAEALKARVQGDNGEIYSSVEDLKQ